MFKDGKVPVYMLSENPHTYCGHVKSPETNTKNPLISWFFFLKQDVMSIHRNITDTYAASIRKTKLECITDSLHLSMP